MFFITSAAYVTPALASEFGKLPPSMLPVQNRRLYEHQIELAPEGEDIILSLPESYELTKYDEKRLVSLGVTIVKTPDLLTLGQSIVYVLNVLGRYSEDLKILHGDTLFTKIPDLIDLCAVAIAEDNYDWAQSRLLDHSVYAGYFSFSDQSLLIKKITENGYDFIAGVEAYGKVKELKDVVIEEWMDFGLSNSYYRSISRMTTQRVFNSIKVTRYGLRKSSNDKRKMAAEANWIESLPVVMKHYAPVIWDKGEEGEKGYYEIEYYFLSSLANLFVFGRMQTEVWKEIINACVEYLNDESNFYPHQMDKETIAFQNNKLYAPKTLERLTEYAEKSGVSLDERWRINNQETPSLREIVTETDSEIAKNATQFVTLMHGDFCFSNILYDFKSKTIKVIDPRGLDLDGNLNVYGDFRYDVAKLSHSILGMYDYIISGRFDYDETSKYSVFLRFEEIKELEDIRRYFKEQKFGGYTFDELGIYPILIHLFLSMLPLHCDNPKRQKAMLANALRLYVEYIKQKSQES